MAELMFISETGMFHSACRCTWGTVVEWYGFKPLKHRSPAGQGMVDRSDRSSFMFDGDAHIGRCGGVCRGERCLREDTREFGRRGSFEEGNLGDRQEIIHQGALVVVPPNAPEGTGGAMRWPGPASLALLTLVVRRE
jgi:hypothetical protein